MYGKDPGVIIKTIFKFDIGLFDRVSLTTSLVNVVGIPFVIVDGSAV